MSVNQAFILHGVSSVTWKLILNSAGIEYYWNAEIMIKQLGVLFLANYYLYVHMYKAGHMLCDFKPTVHYSSMIVRSCCVTELFTTLTNMHNFNLTLYNQMVQNDLSAPTVQVKLGGHFDKSQHQTQTHTQRKTMALAHTHVCGITSQHRKKLNYREFSSIIWGFLHSCVPWSERRTHVTQTLLL